MWDIFLGEHAKNKSPTLMTVQHCAKWTCRFIFAQEPWKWNSIIALQLFALKIIFLQAIKLKSNHIILFAIFSWLEVSCVSTLKLVWDFFLLLTISYYKAPKKCKFKWNGHCRLWFSVVLGWYSAQVGGGGQLTCPGQEQHSETTSKDGVCKLSTCHDGSKSKLSFDKSFNESTTFCTQSWDLSKIYTTGFSGQKFYTLEETA